MKYIGQEINLDLNIFIFADAGHNSYMMISKQFLAKGRRLIVLNSIL